MLNDILKLVLCELGHVSPVIEVRDIGYRSGQACAPFTYFQGLRIL